MTLELAGFPGCGKTTLLNKIETDCFSLITTEEFFRARKKMSMWGLAIKSFLFLIFNPLLIFRTARYFRGITPKKRANRFFKTFVFFVFYDIFIKKSRGKPLIMDQGIYQNIWSFRQELNEKSLAKLLKSIKSRFDIYVIYIKVDPAIAAQRATSRKGKLYLDNLPEDELLRIYETHKNDYLLFKKYLGDSMVICESECEFFEAIKKIKENQNAL